MGIKTLFDNTTNLSGFSENTTKSSFGAFKHVSKIDINEEKLTTVFAKPPIKRVFSSQLHFECNHPFLFIIHDKKYNKILFAGIYRGPS